MHKRGSILAITFLSVLIVVVACGRASEDDINKALGIVPTATLTDEQIAQATEAANAAASAIAMASSAQTGAEVRVSTRPPTLTQPRRIASAARERLA